MQPQVRQRRREHQSRARHGRREANCPGSVDMQFQKQQGLLERRYEGVCRVEAAGVHQRQIVAASVVGRIVQRAAERSVFRQRQGRTAGRERHGRHCCRFVRDLRSGDDHDQKRRARREREVSERRREAQRALERHARIVRNPDGLAAYERVHRIIDARSQRGRPERRRRWQVSKRNDAAAADIDLRR